MNGIQDYESSAARYGTRKIVMLIVVRVRRELCRNRNKNGVKGLGL